MEKLIFQNFHEGLAPRYFQGPSSTLFGTDGMYASGICNPLITLGYLSPSNDTFTAYSEGTTLIGNSIVPIAPVLVDDNNNGPTSLYFGAATKIHAVNLQTSTLVNAAEFPHTATTTVGLHNGHTGQQIQDAVLYTINGVRRFLYFYTDDTDADMGTYDLVSSFTQENPNEAAWSNAARFGGGSATVLSIVGSVSGADTRDIITEVSDNGFLYVANGSVLHKFDGTTNGGGKGTVTENVLNLGAHRKFHDLRDGRGKLWCVIKERGTVSSSLAESDRFAGVAIWNRNSTQLSFDDFIPIPGISDIHNLFFHNGVPYVFTSGQDSVVQLRAWTGSSFEIIQEVGPVRSEPATRKSVTSLDNGFIWIAQNGKIFFYGKPAAGFNNALYILGDPGADNNTSGFIIKTGATDLTTGFSISPTMSLVKWPMATDGTTSDIGLVYTKSRLLPKLSTLKGMTVFFKPFTSSSSSVFTIDVYLNGSASSSATYTFSYASRASAGWKFFPMGGKKFTNVNQVQLRFSWPTSIGGANSLKLQRVEIEYDSENKKV